MRTPDEARDFAQRCYWTEPKPEHGQPPGSMKRVTDMIRSHKEQPQPGALMFWQAPAGGGHVYMEPEKNLGYPTIKAAELKEGHVIVGTEGGLVAVVEVTGTEGPRGDSAVNAWTEFGPLIFFDDEDVYVEKVDV